MLAVEVEEDVVRRRLNRGKKAYAFALGVVEEYASSPSPKLAELGVEWAENRD